MERSKGFRSKTRHKLRKKPRDRGKIPVTRMIREFNIGDKVHIVIEPSVQKGQPHPRFHGKTGTIVEKRGKSYLVEVSDNDAKKIVISAPVHLIPQGGKK
jgi:large subunit ribosomal protein L21e